MFFPAGLTTQSDLASLLLAFGISLAKVVILLMVVALIESVIAKYRFFRLPDILLTGFVFGIIAIIATNIL